MMGQRDLRSYLEALSFVPFGEYTTLYGKERMNPVIDVTAVTMRGAPLYLDIFSGHLDHQLVGGTPK